LARRGLEPDEGKLSSPVLRGERGSDVFLSYPTTLLGFRWAALYWFA